MAGKSISPFTILGFKTQWDSSWVLLAMLMVWSLATGYFPDHYLGLEPRTYWWMGAVAMLGFLASLVFHELAHSVVARHLGIPIKKIRLFIFGGVAEMDGGPPSPKAELYMAIAGPISSLALSAASYLAFEVGYRQDVPVPILGTVGFLSFANSLLGVINLVPGFPLDGGRALRAALWRWTGDIGRATRLASRVGSIFGLVLILGGVFHVVTGNVVVGIWWVVLGLFLRGAAGASYYEIIARTMLHGEPLSRFMTPNPEAVSADLPLDELVEKHFYRSLHDIYPVVQDARLVGCISSKQITGIPQGQWKQVTVRDLAAPCTAENTLNANADALDALSRMSRTGHTRLMVVEGDRLVGIVTLKDLLKLITLRLNLEDAA
jgi:Zn-dependent protease/CBS domain-containing protein